MIPILESLLVHEASSMGCAAQGQVASMCHSMLGKHLMWAPLGNTVCLEANPFSSWSLMWASFWIKDPRNPLPGGMIGLMEVLFEPRVNSPNPLESRGLHPMAHLEMHPLRNLAKLEITPVLRPLADFFKLSQGLGAGRDMFISDT